MLNTSNCSECGSEKVEHCLCQKCTQKVINGGHKVGLEEGKRLGAKQAYQTIADNIVNNFDWENTMELTELMGFINAEMKRLAELEKKL